MIYKISQLQPNMACIYKINYPNNKIYIGCTIDLKRRMKEHNHNSHQKLYPCDLAIKKYGKITEVEVLEFINNLSIMEEREKYWISFYNSNNKQIGYNLTKGGDACNQNGENNSRAVFTNKEVLDIRKRRFLKERKKDVYQDYKNHPFGSFEKVWLGHGYPNIGAEYLIPTNSKTRAEYSSEANQGVKNGRAKCSREQVLDIRKRYNDGESFVDIQKIYNFLSKSTVRRIALKESYSSIK